MAGLGNSEKDVSSFFIYVTHVNLEAVSWRLPLCNDNAALLLGDQAHPLEINYIIE